MERRLLFYLTCLLPLLVSANANTLFTLECPAPTLRQLSAAMQDLCLPLEDETAFHCLMEEDNHALFERAAGEKLLSGAPVARHSRAEAREHYRARLVRFVENDLTARALPLSQTLYRLFEENATIAFDHTMVLFRNDRYDEALETARRLNAVHPTPEHAQLVERIAATLSESTPEVQPVPEGRSEGYAQALKLFDEGRFTQAYPLLGRLYTAYPDDTSVAFLYGRCAFELDKFNTAETAFAHAHLLNPGNTRVTLELARTHFRMHRYEASRRLFDEVLASDAPQDVKKNVSAYIAQIDHYLEKNRIEGILRFGIGHDSNIDSISDLATFSVYLPSVGVQYELPNSAEKEDAVFHEELFALQHTYDFGRKEGWALQSTVALINRDYLSHSAKDIFYASLASGPTWRAEEVNVALPLILSAVRFGHHRLFNEYGFHPRLSFGTDYRIVLKLDGYGGRRIFEQPADKDKSADVIGAGFHAGKSIGTRYALKIGTDLRKESKHGGERTDVDFTSHALYAAFAASINQKHAVTLKYTHKRKKFDDYNLLFLSKRDDTSKNYALTYDYPFTKAITLSAQYNHTDNRSNHDPFVFKRSMLFGAVSVKF